MKRLLFIIFSLSLFCNTFAQNTEINDLVISAEEKYKSQDYESVVNLYESILQKGQSSAYLYYNLGNAYFKLGSLPKAILYYEKASLLEPNNKDITSNLEFAKQQQPDNLEYIPDLLIIRGFQFLYKLCSVDTWAVLSLIFLVLLCVSIIVFVFTQILVRKKVSFTVIIFCLLFGIMSFFCASARYNELNNQAYAIIMEQTTDIKTEPIITSKNLATIHGGLKVKIIDEAFGWFKVRMENGKKGWILAECVEKI